MYNLKQRLTGMILVIASTSYLSWLLVNMNSSALWLSIPFVLTNIYLIIMSFVAVINNWTKTPPQLLPVAYVEEPEVVVIIPTYDEDQELIWNTLLSIFEQDYPKNRIKVFITDDGRRSLIDDMVQQFAQKYGVEVYYHKPAPHKNNKAGNMNSCLKQIEYQFPDVRFIETRDCDDLVQDTRFLRYAVGQLLEDTTLAYTQSIKECVVGNGDHFGNLEPTFYREGMLARHNSNSIFPCGSGVVYRVQALQDIGGFDTSGPVEDIRTGYKLLQMGWNSAHLPLVGAYGQSAPEDIPNFYKQRGTWAVDTQSLLIWDSPLFAKGLSWRQRLSFLELNMFYTFSFLMLFLMLIPMASLIFGVYPVVATHMEYAKHFWPFAIAIELFLVACNPSLSYEKLWKSRQIWIGLSPIFALATIKAILLGPNKKPSYKLTRKYHVHGLYLKQVMPQLFMIIVLGGSILFHLKNNSIFFEADLGSIFWSGFFIFTLTGVVKNSWYGWKFKLPKVNFYKQEQISTKFALINSLIILLSKR